jgi:hypothetical protein
MISSVKVLVPNHDGKQIFQNYEIQLQLKQN